MNEYDDSVFEDWSTDYSQLGEEVLAKLALGDDIFVATSALSEIKQRNKNLAKEISIRILNSSMGDKYLQSSAISSLIPFYLSDLYECVLKGAKDIETYVFNSMLSDMCDEVGVINKDDIEVAKVIGRLCEMMLSFSEKADKETMDLFLRYYCKDM